MSSQAGVPLSVVFPIGNILSLQVQKSIKDTDRELLT